MSFLIEEILISLGGVKIHTLNLYPFSFEAENTKLKTFVKCKIFKIWKSLNLLINFHLIISCLNKWNTLVLLELVRKALESFQKDEITHQTGIEL